MEPDDLETPELTVDIVPKLKVTSMLPQNPECREDGTCYLSEQGQVRFKFFFFFFFKFLIYLLCRDFNGREILSKCCPLNCIASH